MLLYNIFSYASSVAVQVLILFVLIVAGYILRKTNQIKKEGLSTLINVLFYAVSPLMVINSFAEIKYSPSALKELITVMLCAAVTFIIGYLIGTLAFRKKDFSRSMLRTAVMFSNCGFMSLPLANALIGAKGVFLVSAYVAVNNIVIWTVGYHMFTGSMSLKKAFINPGVIAIIIGMIIFVFDIPLPSFLATSFGYISDMNTPLAMFIIGSYLAATTLKPQKGDGKMWAAIALRLLVVPTLCLTLFSSFAALPFIVLQSVIIPVSAPSATNVMVFAAKFEGDAETGSRLVPISTLCSIISMPLFLTMAQLFKNTTLLEYISSIFR